MAEREELLGRLQARLRRAEELQDVSPLLDPAALTESRRLVSLLDDQDIKARLVLGWLHWHRYLALPEGQDEDDLATADDMLSFCFIHDALDEALPELLLPHLADHAVPTALAMLERALESTEAAAITATTRIWQRIVRHTPTDHPQHVVYLGNLAVALQLQFGRFGASTDLDEAIRIGRRTVEATPTDHPRLAGYLGNLGAALQTRFHRSGAAADLDEAIVAGRHAVQATPTGHPDRAKYLSNLAAALQARFHRSGTSADLNEAVDAGRQAVEATLTDHAKRATYLSNLGGALRSRFLSESGTSADLNEAAMSSDRPWKPPLSATPTAPPARAIWGTCCNCGSTRPRTPPP